MSIRDRLGIALLCAFLLVLFAIIRFPYDRMQPAIVALIEGATGARVEIDSCTGGLAWTGPRLRLEGLALHFPSGDQLSLDRVALRPALSYRWLLADPSAAIDARGPAGRARGALGPRHLELELEEVDLSAFPRAWLGGEEPPVEGLLTAELDLVLGDLGYEGPLALESSDGNLILPGLPLAIPFESLEGNFELTESGDLVVEALELEGPMVSAITRGSVGTSATPLETAALELDIELLQVDRALHATIARYGGKLDGDGAAQFRLSGTVGRPNIE